jgi:O-antigen ligase
MRSSGEGLGAIMSGAAGQMGFRTRLASLDWRTIDFRAIAAPIAIASPLALIISAQEPVMVTVALLFLAHSWREREWSWLRSGWLLPLLALWIYAFVRTLLLHPTATGVLTAFQWIHFAVYAAALAAWILPDAETRNRLLWALAATIAFFSLDCLLQYAIGYDIIGRPRIPDRLTSVFGKPGVGAEISWLFMPAVAGLWQRKHALYAAVLGALALAAVLLTGDRMALLIALAAIVLFLLVAARASRALLLALPVFALVLGGLLYFNPNIYARQVASTEATLSKVGDSVYGLIFKTALNVALDHPVFGVGVHNYQTYCVDEKYGPLLVGPEDFKRCQGHPHNVYLQWLVETGGVGLALYAAFAATTIIVLLRGAPSQRGNILYDALAITLALRLWPIETTTSFYSTWSSAPLFLVIGWTFAYLNREEGRE